MCPSIKQSILTSPLDNARSKLTFLSLRLTLFLQVVTYKLLIGFITLDRIWLPHNILRSNYTCICKNLCNCTKKYLKHWLNDLDYILQNRFVMFSQTKIGKCKHMHMTCKMIFNYERFSLYFLQIGYEPWTQFLWGFLTHFILFKLYY